MTWNYRVMRYQDEIIGDSFGIHEVYYDDGTPSTFTEKAVGVVADTTDELREVLAMMASAIEKPALEYSDFPKEAVSGP